MLNNFVFKWRKFKQLDKFHEAWLKFASPAKVDDKECNFWSKSGYTKQKNGLKYVQEFVLMLFSCLVWGQFNKIFNTKDDVKKFLSTNSPPRKYTFIMANDHGWMVTMNGIQT